MFMMTELDVQSPVSEPIDGDAGAQECSACGHAAPSHDAIAERYCRASRDRALDRACVCPARASAGDPARGREGGPARRPEAPMYGRGRVGPA